MSYPPATHRQNQRAAMTAPPISAHLRKRTLAHEDGLGVVDTVCTSPTRGWSAMEPCAQYMLVFPRRGTFMRRVGRHETLLDPGTAYFERPGLPQQIAHPG